MRANVSAAAGRDRSRGLFGREAAAFHLGVTNLELRVFRSLEHGDRRELPAALGLGRLVVLRKQRAAPFEEESRRPPSQYGQRPGGRTLDPPPLEPATSPRCLARDR